MSHGLCSQMACAGRATRERRQTMKQKFKKQSARLSTFADLLPMPPGPGIVLHTKRPVPCLTSRGPRARSRDPRAGPQICPSPKQWIISFTLNAKLLSRAEWGEVPRIKVAQKGRTGGNPSDQSCSAEEKSIGSKLLSRGETYRIKVAQQGRESCRTMLSNPCLHNGRKTVRKTMCPCSFAIQSRLQMLF